MVDPVYEGPEDPVDAEEAEVLDPSTPFIDKTAAGPQIAAPGGEAPELADADETLAGAPNAAPAAPVGSVVTPPPAAATTPQEAGAGAFGASQEEIQALKDRAAAGQELDENERQRLAQATTDDADIRVQRELEAQSQKDARDEYIAKKNAADEKVRDFKFHDYFDDPKHGSKTLARFAVFLGGLGNLGGQAPGSPNRALDGLEENIKADHDTQLAYLNSAKYFAEKQGEGVTDLLKQQASDRAQAELDYSNKKLATADKFAELAQTARGKQNYDAAMIEVAKLKKSAYDDQQKVFQDIAQQKLEDAKAQHQLRLAGRGRGTGGGGSAAAFQAFTDAAGQLKPGDPIPSDVIAKALKAGVKRDKIAAQVDAYRNSGTKSEPKTGKAGAASQTFDPSRAVYGEGHKLLGYAGARTAPDKITQRVAAFGQAIRFLQKLHDSGRILPVGADLHNAALALVGTTTGPANEITQKHEEGALKDAAGLLDPEAIQVRIDDAKERYQQLLDSLIQPSDAAPKQEHTPEKKAALDRLSGLGAEIGAYGG